MNAAKQASIITSLQRIASGSDLTLEIAAKEGDATKILATVSALLTETEAISATKLAGRLLNIIIEYILNVNYTKRYHQPWIGLCGKSMFLLHEIMMILHTLYHILF